MLQAEHPWLEMEFIKLWIGKLLRTHVTRKHFEIFDSDRRQKETVTCSSLGHLEEEVRKMFRVEKDLKICFCMEETGSRIRSDEYLISLNDHSRLMMLKYNETWFREPYILCQGCSPKHTTLLASNVTPQLVTPRVDVRGFAGQVCMDEGIIPPPRNDGRKGETTDETNIKSDYMQYGNHNTVVGEFKNSYWSVLEHGWSGENSSSERTHFFVEQCIIMYIFFYNEGLVFVMILFIKK